MLDSKARIRDLNDKCRQSLGKEANGCLCVTQGVRQIGDDRVGPLLGMLATFETFTPDNDPHEEHDFGAIDYIGRKFFWKIDYYDLALESGSHDPGDVTITRRVLTLMLADEY
jgi:hypothetical protein